MYKEISQCRISKSSNLITVLSLGEQYLSGVFPKKINQQITKGPLDLVWCPDSGLLQLKQSYSLEEMYGENYGYRSGLNTSMVKHLTNKIRGLENIVSLTESDLVLDIGSNDATSLKAYTKKCKKLGVDPTGEKFREYYEDGIDLIPDFFSESLFRKNYKNNAKIITSIAMFYDLENPVNFVRDIYNCLSEDGIWHFEQSYMPSMLRTNAYDTVCHEHLEYYSFRVVKELLENNGMRIIDVQMNSVNGGSFAITATKKNATYRSNDTIIEWMLKQESNLGLDTPKPFRDFEERVFKHRKDLKSLIDGLNADGKKIFGYGASTKGNILLQFCNLTSKDIPFIAEVNESKFGSYTPGTNIPIISESEAHKMKPDYLLVLPWHFKNSIIEREAKYLERGGKLIFPLPEIEIF